MFPWQPPGLLEETQLSPAPTLLSQKPDRYYELESSCLFECYRFPQSTAYVRANNILGIVLCFLQTMPDF